MTAEQFAMSLTPTKIAEIDATIAALETSQKLLKATADGLATITGKAAWFVAVVSPGFLGMIWDAKELSEYTRYPPTAFYWLYAMGQGCFVSSIIGAMLTYWQASYLTSEIHEQTVMIAGLVLALSEQKRTGEIAEDFESNELKFRTSLHDLEVALTKGTPKPIKVAEEIYAPVGISGYAFVAIIIAGAYFVARVGQ
jgi:hypothetical protein